MSYVADLTSLDIHIFLQSQISFLPLGAELRLFASLLPRCCCKYCMITWCSSRIAEFIHSEPWRSKCRIMFSQKNSPSNCWNMLDAIGCYWPLWNMDLMVIMIFSSERRVSSERLTFNVWAVQYLYFGDATAAQSFAASASGVWLEIRNNLKGRRGQTLTIDWTSSGFERRTCMYMY